MIELQETIVALEGLAQEARRGYYAVATDRGPPSPQEREAFSVLLGIELRLAHARASRNDIYIRDPLANND